MRVFLRVVAVTAFAIGITACTSKAPDPTGSAERALKDAKLGDVKVQWDGDARIAHLKGTVDSSGERAHAEDIAQSVVGTSGKILNELTVKGLNEHTADDLDGQIRSTLKKMIDDDHVLRDRDVKFEVANGVVTVKGEVRTVAEKTKVTEIVRAAPGVKDMANALEIRPKK